MLNIKFKGLISYIIIFTILLYTMSPGIEGIAEGKNNDLYTAGEVVDFEENVKLLQALGVITEDTLQQPSTTVTKGDFAKLWIRFLEGGKAPAQNDDYYVSEGKRRGIIVENENAKYSAEDFINYQEVVGGIVEGLGYSVYIKEDNPSPASYIFVANDANILTGVSGTLDVYMTYIDVVKLLINSLDVPLVVQTKYTMGNPVFSKEDNMTALSSLFKMRKYKGVVTATTVSPLFKQNKTSKGKVSIDNKIFDTAVNCDKYLGMTVNYYVTIKDDEIIFIGREGKFNNILELKDEQIEKFASQVYHYRENGENSTTKATLATPCYVNYNGMASYFATTAMMTPKIGSVTLIDNNKDGDYDVAFVRNYTIKIVQTVDVAQDKIYFNDGTVTEITTGKHELRNHGGKEISIENISPKDVVYYSASENDSFIYIGVLKKKVSGIVTAYSSDPTKDVITADIDGKTYTSVDGWYHEQNISINKNYTFYLDGDDKIAALMEVTSIDGYGYLIKAEMHGLSGLKMKIFSQNGKMLVLDAAAQVRIDEVMQKTPAKILGALTKGSKQAQLIQYTTNSKGEISTINTAYNYNKDYVTAVPPVIDGTSSSKEDVNSLRVTYSSTLNGEGNLAYWSVLKSFNGRVSVDSKTLVFQIPDNVEKAENKNFMVGSVANLVNEDKYTIDAFTDEENAGVAKVIVTYGGTLGSKIDYIGVVMSKTDVVGADGIATKLTFGGPPGVEMVAENYDCKLTNVPGYWGAAGDFTVDVGDIVRAYIVNGELKLIQMVYDMESNTAIPCPGERKFGGMQRYEFGSVYTKYNNYISITTKGLESGDEVTNADLQYYNTAQFRMIKVDKNVKGKTKVYDTPNDLIIDYKTNKTTYSRVFVYSSYGSPWTIVVY